MTSPDAPPTSRRALREQAARRAGGSAPEAAPVAEPASDVATAVELAGPEDAATGVDGSTRRIALAWVDADTLIHRGSPGDLTAASSAYVPVLPELLPRKRRSWRGALLVLGVLLVALAGYTTATQLWSLENLPPAVETAELPAVTAPDSALSWPEAGTAAAGVDGVDAVASSSGAADAIASITKLVTALMVLDERPLAVGEQGDEREITYADRVDYWSFLGRGESAINVPVGGTLTQYQLLQGTLIASAGNYATMLADELWPTDDEFAAAARDWLDGHELSGITVVEPTGIDRGNTADPASLIRLAEIAMDEPVVAEIVGTRTAEIPGAGEIENTNALLADESVVGVKTGGLTGHYNLLAAQDVPAGDTTVRVYAAVLGQPTEALRADETAELLDRIAAEATVPQTLAAGTTVGTVSTPWGSSAELVTAADAAVLLWNGDSATVETDLGLDDAQTAGEIVGALTLTGPLDSATTDVTLTAALGSPDPWWRFTHPLELFGLTE